jgi:outer membrane protein OmpA-like peptidoglycan-associated protein
MERNKSTIQQLNYTCFIVLQLFMFHIVEAQQSFYCKERLPDIVNSYSRTLLPVLHPSGTRLYFVRKEHPDNIGGISDPDDIWYTDRISNNYWTSPINAGPTINTRLSNALFSITSDGNSAFIATVNALGNLSFHMADVKKDTWDIKPALTIKDFVMRSPQYFATMNADQNVLILAMNHSESMGDLDLYVSFKESDNVWSSPVWMGKSINTSSREGSPFIAQDNKTLYYYSNGLGGFGGSDLFLSRRLDDSWTSWSKPVNLGPYINTSGNERSITLTARGDTACIISTDTTNDREGMYFVCLQPDIRPEEKKVEALPQVQKPFSNTTLELYFENNQWKLTSTHRSQLQEICDQVKDRNKFVIIKGYTDDVGTVQYNKKLSIKRAQSITDYLKTCGLQSLDVSGEGIREINTDISTKERRAKSRAVTIYMTIQQ